MANELSSESEERCECCRKVKMCKMYMLQSMEAAWVCIECREGKPSETRTID